jgi:thiopeptide-type bacteriocin biosynthesis protein
MLQDTGDNWLSCHIYYDAIPDKMLVQSVRPFIQQTLGKGCVGYFFIRYFDEQGPHIRLRFKLPPELREKMKAEVTVSFPTVRFIRYEPETSRYGGSKGVAVSERFFEASSTAVLEYMFSEAAQWNYSLAMGAALQLQVGMASGLGMSANEATQLFTHIVQDCRQDDRIEDERLAEAFYKQREYAVAQLRGIWSMCEGDVECKERWFSDWQHTVQSLGDELRQLWANGGLHISPLAAHETNQLWSLYESYIHMTNNRLGILRQDEALIAYIVREALAVYG